MDQVSDQVACPECGKTFPGDHMLNWHRESVHTRNLDSVSLVDNPSATVSTGFCTKCGHRLDVTGSCRNCSQQESTLYWEEQEQKGKVRAAVICGFISGAVTLIAAIAQIFGPGSGLYLDVVLTFGLTIGILLRNRGCAIVMFIYWIISKIVMLAAGGWIGIPVGILFGVFFYRAIPATFALHRIRMARRELRQPA